MLSVCVSSFSGIAQAEPLEKEDTNTIVKPLKDFTETTEVEEYEAKVILNTSTGSQVMDITDPSTTLKKIFETNNVNLNDFKTEDSKPVDGEYSLKNEETLSLFKTEITGTSEIIVLNFPEVTKETDELFVGETEIESEGTNGEALKTTLTTTMLASDKEFNSSTTASSNSVTEDKLTILTAPTPKVTLVGTKPIPEPEPEPEPEPVITSTTSSKNSKTYTDTVTLTGDQQSDVVALAEAQLGKPYIWGAAGPNAFDCSGLVYYIYHDHKGFNIPRTANAQGMYSTPVAPENIAVGDILWTPKHIGIYVGDGKIIHAPNPSKPVSYANLDSWLNSGYKIGRF